MKLLHSLGERLMSNYNSPDDLIGCDDDISFDGCYLNIMNYLPQLKEWKQQYKREVYLFVQMHTLDGDNGREFKRGIVPKLERMCGWKEIFEIADALDAHIGHHSVTHRDMTSLTIDEIIEEFRPPFPMKYAAWPYGRCDGRTASVLMHMGYEAAWAAGPHGDGSQFQKKRSYLNW